MKLHSKASHGSESRYQCNDCDKNFKRDKDLLCHIETVHAEKMDKTYKCKICDTEFVRGEIFKEHNKTCHMINLDFQCQQCQKTLPNGDKLKNHIEECHERSVWEKTFSNPSASH